MTESLDPTPDFLNEPTFLPRVTQHDGRAIEEALAATLFDQGVRLRTAVIEASYAAADPPLIKRLREDGVTRLVEPQTQRFTTRRFLEVEQLASLPYAPDEPIAAETFDADAAKSIAVGALRFEQEQRCEYYLSPAVPYYDRDFQKWVAHNDRLLEEACSANGGAEIDRRPLIAQVFPGRSALKQPEFVINRLLDYPIVGAYVQPLLFDPVRDSPEKLRLYVEFLLAIAAEGIPVIASRIGAFGLVLAALGINAFDSGLAQAEASNLAQLNRPLTERERERRREGKGGGPDKRIYFEILKTTMKGTHATVMLDRAGLRSRFVCNHNCCQYRGFEDLAARRRQHFLCSRDAEVADLRRRPSGELRLDLVREQLRDAQETGRVVRRALMDMGATAPRFEHLDRWMSLLASDQLLSGVAH
jgi:hypothetical protein